MAIAKKLFNYLEKNKVKYEIVEHRPVHTAWDLVQTLHLKKPGPVIKTLVVKTDREAVIVVLSAHRNLDKMKFKKAVNQWRKKQGLKAVKKISFAPEAWLKKNLKIGKLGSVPPFGQLLGWPVFVDSLVFKEPSLIIPSGDYQSSFKITTKDFIKLENPIKVSLGKKK
jgi:Ala-tRNA(Pro) deacylase